MNGEAKGIGSEELRGMFGVMYDELVAWRKQHPHASADEIFAQITPRRRKLMGKLMVDLALQLGSEACPEVLCEQCGAPMVYKGEASRDVEHLEGEVELLVFVNPKGNHLMIEKGTTLAIRLVP